MRARNPLYVMAKPPPEAQAAIAALPCNDPGRSPDLLHVTLISFYDLHTAPPKWLPATPALSWRRTGWLRRSPFPLRVLPPENRQAVTLQTRGVALLRSRLPIREKTLSYIIRPCSKLADEQNPFFRAALSARNGPAGDRHWADLS